MGQQIKDLEENTILSSKELKARPGLIRRVTEVRKKLELYEKLGVSYEMLRTFLLAPELKATDLNPEVLDQVATMFPTKLVNKEILRRWRKDDKDRQIYMTTDAVVNNLAGIYLKQGVHEMAINKIYQAHGEKVPDNLDYEKEWKYLKFANFVHYCEFHAYHDNLEDYFAHTNELCRKRFLKVFAPQTWKKLMEHQQYIDFARGMPACLAAEDLTCWRDAFYGVRQYLTTLEVGKIFTKMENKRKRDPNMALSNAGQRAKNTR